MSAESGKGIDEVIAKTEQITVATDVSKNFDAIEKPMGNNNDPAEDAAAAALETVDPESLEMEPFNCTICGMSELCYFFSDGYLPLGISPGSFCILDPFDQFEKNADFTNPSSFDDVIVLGSLCSICGSSVCVDSSCSVYFEQTFCRECALYEPNKEMFPPEVLKGMEESIKKREESRKKHEAESKKPELAATSKC